MFEKWGLRGPIDPAAGVVLRTLGVVVGLLGLLPLLPPGSFRLAPLRTWYGLAAGGFVASIAGQLCFYRALKEGEVSRVVPVGASYPVLACLLGLALFHEPMTRSKAAGVALVLVGVFLLR